MASRGPKALGKGGCSCLLWWQAFPDMVPEESRRHGTYVQHMLDLLVWKGEWNLWSFLKLDWCWNNGMSPCLPLKSENQTTILSIHHHNHHYGDTPALRKDCWIPVQDTDGEQLHISPTYPQGLTIVWHFLWGRTHRTAMASVPVATRMMHILVLTK